MILSDDQKQKPKETQTEGEKKMESRAAGAATTTPPYPSAARISDSLCYPQYTASLKCKSFFLFNISFVWIYRAIDLSVPVYLMFSIMNLC